ncbi:MAG: hypothetical protein ACFFA7_14950 [Promethearchaeota archaeon]
MYPIYLFSDANSIRFGEGDYAHFLVNFFSELKGEKYEGIDQILRLTT